jgi:hypothetical protein
MATKIKIITANDFIEVTPDGVIDITTSRKLLADIAKAENHPVDFELLVDFRDTHSNLSTVDVYVLAGELKVYGDTFRRKVALLVHKGVNFDCAKFFETCSHNCGFLVNAFTNYEKAMRWILSTEDSSNNNDFSNNADANMESATSNPQRGAAI